MRSQLSHYAFETQQGDWVICGDLAIFQNHSDNPCCDDIMGYPGNLYPDQVTVIAKKRIERGEELTSDYRKFDCSFVEGF